MEKKKEQGENSLKKIKDFRQLKHGSYSIILIVAVVVVVVLLNLVVRQIPSQYTEFDFSGLKLSSLTDTTKEVIDSLDEDVTIYYICEPGYEDTNISKLLERYNDFSSHVTVTQIDPVLYPQFTSQYTSDTLYNNSAIVVCGDDSRVVPYGEMYEYTFSYTYYSYSMTGFDAEGQITSAIAALTSENVPKLYVLTGHNEIELTDTLTASIEKQNISIEDLSLMTTDAVPDDASCLLICSPNTDLSAAEAQKVINYLRRGGSAIMIIDYPTDEMPNLKTVLEYYGIGLTEGIIFEGSSSYYYGQYLDYLLPSIKSTDISSDLSYVLMVDAQGIETLDDVRESITYTPILSTSGSAYIKADTENMTTYMKEDEDISGPFDVGAMITESVELSDELLEDTAYVEEDIDLGSWMDRLLEEETEEETEEAEDSQTEEAEDSETEEEEALTEQEEETEAEEVTPETAETRLAVFTSFAMVNDTGNQIVSGGNYQLFVNALSWACDQEETVSVPSKNVNVDYLTLTSASANFWMVVTIIIIPGVILVIGLGIWLSRRRR